MAFLTSARPPRPLWAWRIPYRQATHGLHRTLISPPRSNSGPLLSRRSDRELPPVSSHRRWLRTLPVFAVIIIASTFGIFNYQKSSSSVVSSTLYALRRSDKAREALGDEISFAHRIPWISGELNQLHGRIDISFWVKGNLAKGKMRFKSTRESRMSFFRTEEWSLEMEDGRIIQLLDGTDSDPFQDSTSKAVELTSA
ncbi:hypothetical protein VTO42DRAFT_8493 [Malbranchea cinnamomea]